MSNTPAHHRALSVNVPRIVAVFTVGLLAVGGSIFFAAPAFAAPVTVGGLDYETNPTTLEATVRGLAVGNTDTAIIIPDTIVDGADIYSVTAIDSAAFDSAGLTSVVIGDSVVTIGNSAFRGNAALTSLAIGDSVVVIDNAAFSGTALTSVVIPNSVVTIGSDAFRGNALTTLALGASVESIGSAAFMDAVLTSLALPDTLVSIGGDAFRSNALTSLVIPDSVVGIGNNAFVSNPLTSLTLGNSLQTIGNEAFRGHELTSIVIPASVTQIGTLAFLANGVTLTSVVMQGPAPTIAAASASGSFSSDASNKTVYYPAAFAAQYASPWQEYTTEMGATLDFELDGNGASIAAVTVIPGQSVPVPAAPFADGLTFAGWYTGIDYATPFDFGAPLEAGQNIAYAQWIAADSPGDADGDPVLAVTGVDASPLIWTGAMALLAAGITLVLMRRRGQLTQ